MRTPTTSPLIAVIVLAAATSCGGNDSTTATDPPPATSTNPDSPTVADEQTSTTHEPARPPITNERGDTEEPGFEPIGGATLDVSPTTLRIGDPITFTVHCPRSDGNATMWFDDYRANHLYIDAPPTTDDPTRYETTATVPYYLSPGISIVHAGCVEGVQRPEPVEIEILPSLNGYDELWRPIQHPWIEADRQPGTPPPALIGDAYAEGYGIEQPVHALCDAGIPRTGARFIVWTPIVTDDDFIAVEYPVADDGYDPTDHGVVISADIVVDDATFWVDGTYDPPRVSALCVPTATPFTPEVEPESPRLFVL